MKKNRKRTMILLGSILLLFGCPGFVLAQTNPAVRIDDAVCYSVQSSFEAGIDPNPPLGGTVGTFVNVNNPTIPFSRVMRSNGYYESISDFIPVHAGESLYGEIWAMRESGSTGSQGAFYFGIARYDKDKQPIAGNQALDYFVVPGATVAQNSSWNKYSGTTTLPTSHTPYNGSDGGAVRYVRAYIIVNYYTGTIPTFWGGAIIRRVSPISGTGPVAFNGVSVFSNAAGDNYNENIRLPASSAGWASVVLGATPGLSGTGVGQWTLVRSPESKFSIQHNTTNHFAILPDGKVGIGTTSPLMPLDVNGNVRVLGNLNIWKDASGTTGAFSMQTLTGRNFIIQDEYMGVERLRVNADGNVGIGTSNPQSKLAVNGDIYAKKVKVTLSGWSDYVFEKEYKLKPLSEVEMFIQENKHLPDVPSAAEIAKNDLDLGEMNKVLLQKVEELTLYLIAIEKENKAQKERLDVLEKQNCR